MHGSPVLLSVLPPLDPLSEKLRPPYIADHQEVKPRPGPGATRGTRGRGLRAPAKWLSLLFGGFNSTARLVCLRLGGVCVLTLLLRLRLRAVCLAGCRARGCSQLALLFS